MATTETTSQENIGVDCKLPLSKNEKGFIEALKEASVCSCVDEKVILLNKCASLVQSFTFTQIARLLKSSQARPAFSNVIDLAVIPPFTTRDYFSFDRDDFKGFPVITEAVFNIFYNFYAVLNTSQLIAASTKDPSESELHSHCENQDSIDLESSCKSHIYHWLKLILPKLVELIGAHINKPLWSSSKCQSLATQILQETIIYFSCNSSHELFLLETETVYSIQERKETKENTLLAQILLHCRQSLAKDKWYRYPFLTESFCWIISQIKSPYLSDHIDQVMATALNFIDDHQGDSKIKGILCLHHLLDNTSSEEMRWHNRAEVIYVALEKQMYSRDAAVIKKVLPGLFTVLRVLELSSQSQMNRHHSIMEILLRETEGENLLTLRRIYISNLGSLVYQLGIFSVRHLSTLVKIVQNYLEIEDGVEETARIDALKLLHAVILVTWPRISQHAETILRLLLKFLVEIHNEQFRADRPSAVHTELKELVEKCLISLGELCPDVLPIYLALVNDNLTEFTGMRSVGALLNKAFVK